MRDSILYINHVSEMFGAEKSLLDMLAVIDKQKYQPILACPPGRLADEAKAICIEWIPITLGRFKITRNPFKLIRIYLRFRQSLLEIIPAVKDNPGD